MKAAPFLLTTFLFSIFISSCEIEKPEKNKSTDKKTLSSSDQTKIMHHESWPKKEFSALETELSEMTIGIIFDNGDRYYLQEIYDADSVKAIFKINDKLIYDDAYLKSKQLPDELIKTHSIIQHLRTANLKHEKEVEKLRNKESYPSEKLPPNEWINDQINKKFQRKEADFKKSLGISEYSYRFKPTTLSQLQKNEIIKKEIIKKVRHKFNELQF